MKLTVCIPTYDMRGLGAGFLRHNFDVLLGQTFRDFDVVITDNSESDSIEKVCDEYNSRLKIHYFRNERNVGLVANVNRAIQKATGELIKIIFLDDFLYSKDSLQQIVDTFDDTCRWLVTACEHSRDGVTFVQPHYPVYDDNAIFEGKNTISSPSVLTIRNDHPILFDENMLWLMDVDYYKMCYDRFGPPKILNTINVVNRIGEHQLSNTLMRTSRKKDLKYIDKKYAKTKTR